MKTSTIISTLFAAALMSGSFSAQAAPTVTTRVVHGLGNVIAAQGNEAFREMREELKDTMLRTLKPLLPSPAKHVDADLPKYVELHQEARAQQ